MQLGFKKLLHSIHNSSFVTRVRFPLRQLWSFSFPTGQMTLWMGPVFKCRVGEFVNLPVTRPPDYGGTWWKPADRPILVPGTRLKAAKTMILVILDSEPELIFLFKHYLCYGFLLWLAHRCRLASLLKLLLIFCSSVYITKFKKFKNEKIYKLL